MGADIHGVLQECWGDKPQWWSTIEIEDARNYMVFAALAGVRNYHNITPISEPRGFPEGFGVVDEFIETRWGKMWMGDHSHSWLTVKELLEWDGWNQTVKMSGVVSRKAYEEGPPHSSYGRSVGGGMVVMATEYDKPEGWNYIFASWDERLSDMCGTFLAWLRYAELKGNETRIVFGFDS